MSEYDDLCEFLGTHTRIEPSSDEGMEEIHDAIVEGRVASFVDEGEQVFTLAGFGYGRGAVADALDITPDRVDELAADELADLKRKLSLHGDDDE